MLEFLWNDPEVLPRDPALAEPAELPRQRFFPGVGHLVMRNGWEPDSTWIEFDCGAYFSKHQHLSQNHFSIYHRGYLAIDSGADYTDTESPHYLNYYRRTVAHNSILVFDPREKFFWSDNIVDAVNDGGQRMDSARFWNTVRSLDDWERTRDLWSLGNMRVVGYQPGSYDYALGDARRRTPRPNSSASRANCSTFRPPMFCWYSTGWSVPIPISKGMAAAWRQRARLQRPGTVWFAWGDEFCRPG